MNEHEQKKVFSGCEKNVCISVFAVCITVILSSLIVSSGLGKIIKPQRTVVVRGLSEREVDADFAVWPLTFSTGSNDMNELQKDILSKIDIVAAFLEKHGIGKELYSVQTPKITDNTLNPYIEKKEIKWAYIAEVTVMVRSADIAMVKTALDNSLSLLGDGIAVSKNYDARIEYLFTGLNAIKPEMIADATKNARDAAEQFAHDSLSKVGKIKSATQGLFSITDAAPGLVEKKNVRVVTTVEYILVD